MNKWGERSLKNYDQCHKDLQVLADHVLQIHDCSIICGHRGKEEQNQAFYLGNSKLKYPNSRHNQIPSAAIDIVPYGQGNPYDREQMLYFAGIVVATAAILYNTGIIEHKIRWGGDWDIDNNFKEHKFFDAAHLELVFE